MPVSLPDGPDLTQASLAVLEQRITVLTLAIERQNVQIGRIADILVDLRNRVDWNAAQMSELLRIVAAGVRDLRETQIYSLLADGPVSVADLNQLQAITKELQERSQQVETTRVA